MGRKFTIVSVTPGAAVQEVGNLLYQKKKPILQDILCRWAKHKKCCCFMAWKQSLNIKYFQL